MYIQDYFENYHPFVLQKYDVPKSSLNRDLRKIYPLLQSRNISHLQKRVEVGEIAQVKAIEILNLKVQMNKNVLPTDMMKTRSRW